MIDFHSVFICFLIFSLFLDFITAIFLVFLNIPSGKTKCNSTTKMPGWHLANQNKSVCENSVMLSFAKKHFNSSQAFGAVFVQSYDRFSFRSYLFSNFSFIS